MRLRSSSDEVALDYAPRSDLTLDGEFHLFSVQRQRLIRAGAVLVLLLAVLPNVLYVGHLPIPGLEAEHIHTPAEAQHHAEHCHLGPSSCSDQPGLVGVWWVGGDPAFSLPDLSPRQLSPAMAFSLPETIPDVLTPPPRFV